MQNKDISLISLRKRLANIPLLRAIWQSLPLEIRKLPFEIYYSLRDAKNLKFYKNRSVNKPKKIEKIAVIGTFDSVLSHAMVSRLLCLELDKIGKKYEKIDVSFEIGASKSAPLDMRNIAARINSCDAIIYAINPGSVYHAIARIGPNLLKDKYAIGYWVWELPEIPQNWAKCGAFVDEIWTPSRYSGNAIKAKIDKKIRIAPHPVALLPMHETELNRNQIREKYGISSSTFVVLQSFSMLSNMERKNPIGLINAMNLVFGADDDVLLIIRCLFTEREKADFYSLRQAALKSAVKVRILESEGDINEMFELYRACDVYASLHRAEGFGLNLFEAMRYSIPVLATDWSGNNEIVPCDAYAPISGKPIPVKVAKGVYRLPNQEWYEPNQNEAAEKLRQLFDNPKLKDQIAENGRNAVEKNLKGSITEQFFDLNLET